MPHGDRAAESGRDHHVGATTLLGVRHLLGQDSRQAGFRHPRTRHDTLPLDPCRGADHRHQVAALVTATLQQERHVQHRQFHAPAPARRQETGGGAPHQRMHDRLQPGQRRRVAEHPRSQGRPVDRPVAHNPRERRVDRRDRGAAARQQTVHRGVGVVHRQPQPAQHAGRRRLSHADRSGQAQHLHRRIARLPAVPISAPAPRAPAGSRAAAAAAGRGP